MSLSKYPKELALVGPLPTETDITLTLLESVAQVLGKQARYNLGLASMLAVDFATEVDNYLSREDINKFFDMFAAAKERYRF